MFKVTFNSGETVLEQDSLPTDDDCLYMLDTGEVDIVIAGSGEAANTNQEERKVGLAVIVIIIIITIIITIIIMTTMIIVVTTIITIQRLSSSW